MFYNELIKLFTNLENVFNIVKKFQPGTLILQPGKHVIQVPTRETPTSVWFSIANAGDMPVCNGDVDKLGYTIGQEGFVLYADVVSDTLQIDWEAVF